MRAPRSAAACGDQFPYADAKQVCYIEVAASGAMTYGVPESEGIERVLDGESKLYAVWASGWSHDLFEVDDLERLAEALGLINSEELTGLTDHLHDVEWTANGADQATGGYAWVDLVLRCGCTVKDIKAFAVEMSHQLGWDVSTSTGWLAREGQVTVKVRRDTLAATGGPSAPR